MIEKEISGADILDLIWKDGQGLADNAALVDVLEFIYDTPGRKPTTFSRGMNPQC